MDNHSHRKLRVFGQRLLVRAGVKSPDAACVINHLVDANLAGHDSHGISLLPSYLDAIKSGQISLNLNPRVVSASGATSVIDGMSGFGAICGRVAVSQAVGLAKRFGVGVVALRNSHHLGRIGKFAELCSRLSVASIHLVNASGGTPLVAPFNGTTARFSTNPFCAAFPSSSGYSIVADFATSVLSYGKALEFWDRGTMPADESIITKHGETSKDLRHYFEAADGASALLPMARHKGYCLAVVCELFAGVMGGMARAHVWGETYTPPSNNMFTIAVDISRFGEPTRIRAAVDALLQYIKTSASSPGTEVQVPGEPEWKARQQRRSEGVSIPDSTWSKLVEAGTLLGLDESVLNDA